MKPQEMRELLMSPALELRPPVDVVDRVRTRGAEVRKTNRRGVAGLVVLAAIGLAIGPGFPDRLVPEGSRQPAAQAFVPDAAEPVALLLVRYAPDAYSSVTTERAVAACTPEAELSFPGGRPLHQVTVAGTRAEVAAVRACLARVPGAVVTQR